MDTNSDTKSIERSLNALAARVAGDDSLDLQTRQAVQKAAQKLIDTVETPGDTFQRIAFLPLHATVIRIALDLGLFEKLGQAGPSGKSLKELEEDTGADPAFLTRLLRHLATIGVIDQVDQVHFKTTPTSKALSDPVAQAGVKHNYDFVGPAFYKLPAYFAKTKYRNPTDAMNGPFQYAYDTQLNGFAWIMQPENSTLLHNFNTWMAGTHAAHWLDWFPVKDEVIKGLEQDEKAVTMVDVGGSLGHELLELKKRYPELPGRLILQDLPETIKNVAETKVFEPTVHDFFTPQPVEGARVYYLRQVLHDWPDDKARLILQNIIPAMRTGYSKIFINEIVIPDVGTGLRETNWDWSMLACLSAMERNEQQWRNILTSVGLKVVKIWSHADSTESIIEVVPA